MANQASPGKGNLPTVWTKHLKTEDQKQKFESAIYASTTLINRLLEILEEEERELDKSSLSSSDFDNPSWAYKQAFKLGEKSRIKKLKDLFGYTSKD